MTNGQLSIVSILQYCSAFHVRFGAAESALIILFRWYVITSSIFQYCSAFCVRVGMNLLNKPLHNIQMLCRIDNEISHPFQSIIVPFMSDLALSNLLNMLQHDVHMLLHMVS
jgi:hypothetical protein